MANLNNKNENRKIKAQAFALELLQMAESFYDHLNGSKEKNPNLVLQKLEEILIKVNGEKHHIFENKFSQNK